MCCALLAREFPAASWLLRGWQSLSTRCTTPVGGVAPLQEAPPKPTDPDVRVIDYEPIQVYVRVFGGFATENTVLEQARTLHAVLDDEDREFDDSLCWLAVYDAPQVGRQAGCLRWWSVSAEGVGLD